MGHDLAAERSSSWVYLAFGAWLAIAAACGDSGADGTSTASSAGGGGSSSSAAGGNGGAGGGGAPTGTTASSTGAGGSGGGASTGTTTSSTGSGGGSPGCGTPAMAGSTTETLDVDGVERTYLVVVPPSLDGSTPAPVLLGFHGGNGTAEYASQTYGLTGDEPVLYVYPQAPFWPEAGGVAWNVDPSGVDFPYFDALLVDLGQKYCVDSTRVFAAGQSNGGFFVNALGCYRPDALRAIAPVAGGGPPGQCTPSTETVMIVHGTADATVPISSAMYSRDYWLESNGCAGAPGAPADPSPCVAYSGCAEPVLWCEHGGGHSWPSFAGAAIRGFFLSL